MKGDMCCRAVVVVGGGGAEPPTETHSSPRITTRHHWLVNVVCMYNLASLNDIKALATMKGHVQSCPFMVFSQSGSEWVSKPPHKTIHPRRWNWPLQRWFSSIRISQNLGRFGHFNNLTGYYLVIVFGSFSFIFWIILDGLNQTNPFFPSSSLSLILCLSHPLSLSLSLSPSIQTIHEHRFQAPHFQDAKHRVPEPSSQYLHCCVWDGHLRLHPQPALLLLPDKVSSRNTRHAHRLDPGDVWLLCHRVTVMFGPCWAKGTYCYFV